MDIRNILLDMQCNLCILLTARRSSHARKSAKTRPAGKKPALDPGGTAAAIIVALLITIAILDSQLEAAALRSDQVLLSITQELQSELVFALRSYNGIYSTGTDVDGSILPTVRQHLNTATALNNILTNGFGGAYSVFTQDLYNRLEHFYSEYELARSANRSTDTAMELLDSCMRDIENIVLTRFEADGRVIL